MLGHEVGHRRYGRKRLAAVFGGGHQPEMPRWHRQVVVAGHRTEHRDTDRLAGLPQHLLVTR